MLLTNQYHQAILGRPALAELGHVQDRACLSKKFKLYLNCEAFNLTTQVRMCSDFLSELLLEINAGVIMIRTILCC